MAPISRRTLLASAVTAPLAASTISARAAGKPPNIVFILADDLGYADVACYGRPDLHTPNIDRLAAEGMKFSQAYANSAVCSATRTALITGRYQYRLRLGLEEPLANNPNVGLPPEHPTLPSLLKKAGYGTTLIGKWHMGGLPQFGPLKSGYDHFWGFRGGALDYYSHQGAVHEDDLWEDDKPIHNDGYLTELLGGRAVESINSYARSGQPFLLSLHFNAPHWPWEAPGDQAESERLKAIGGPFAIVDWDGGTQATYQRMIEAMDKEVGRVLAALEANHLTRDTIVVFTSDNGGERYSDVWPFTGRKTELLEGGLRIPALVRWPARIPRNRVTNQVAISMDWLPTLLEAAGTAPAPDYPSDGMSLLSALTREAAPVSRALYWRYKANAQRAARDGDYKILKIRENTFLFNVVDDPLERANLRDRHRDIYDRMVAAWNAWDRTMLPEVHESFTGGFTGADMADHVGAPPSMMDFDDMPAGSTWPEPPPRQMPKMPKMP